MVYADGFLLLMGGRTVGRDINGVYFIPRYEIYYQQFPEMANGWQTLDSTPLPRGFSSLLAASAGNQLIIAGIDSQSRPGSAMFYSSLKLPSSSISVTPAPNCPDQCFADELWVGIDNVGGVCDDNHPQNVYKCGDSGGLPTGTIKVCNSQAWTCQGSFWSR